MRVPAAALALLTVPLLAGCLGGNGDAPPAPRGLDGDLDAVSFGLVPVAEGLDRPVYATHAGDGTRRLFVLEQEGTVRVVRDGRLLAAPFLDLTAVVRDGGERGLLGLAFDPAFATNGLFYVHYTDNDGDTVLARHRAEPGADVADAAPGVVLLRVGQPFANHNGGMLAFGPDGHLYLALGDGGGAGDTGNRAQDRDELLGKLLRLDVGGGAAGAPADNPFVGRPGHDLVWAYGLRNPWRFSFDRATGDLYVGDVGQNRVEEINFQPARSRGGENYGWNVWEGSKRFRPGTAEHAVFPVAEYDLGGGRCAVTGGYAYRGAAVPTLRAVYVYADYCSGEIWGLVSADGAWRSKLLLDSDLQVSSFGEDEAGELLVVDHGGSVRRFTA